MTTTREHPDQRIVGTVLSERELYIRLIDHLGHCHTIARGLAQSRKDIRFLAIAGIFEESKVKVTALMAKGAGPTIIPARAFR